MYIYIYIYSPIYIYIYIYIYTYIYIYIYISELRRGRVTRRNPPYIVYGKFSDFPTYTIVTILILFVILNLSYTILYYTLLSYPILSYTTYTSLCNGNSGARSGVGAPDYGQFSNFHVCFCGLDPGNLKFETVRTNKQHLCF